jgi:hypothetical protein
VAAAAVGYPPCAPAVACAGEGRVDGELGVSAAKGASDRCSSTACLACFGAADTMWFSIVTLRLFDMLMQLRVLFLNTIVPLYYDQVDVLLMMTTSLSSTYLLIQYLNKIRQKELNPGIKDFDEKIQIIANLTFSLVIALFKPEKLNTQQRFGAQATAAAALHSVSRSHPPCGAEYPSW